MNNAVWALSAGIRAFRESLRDRAVDMAHHWSDEMTEEYGFRMSLGPEDAILMHLPDGRTVRLGIDVTVLEVTP